MSDEPDEDVIVAAVSDYLDGALPPDQRADVAAKIASDPAYASVHTEIASAREALSGLQKARAPSTFAQDVTATIHKRSAGRFFGRRTLGDRVPFGALVVLAVLALAVLGFYMWSSTTGGLGPSHEHRPVPHGSDELLPAP